MKSSRSEEYQKRLDALGDLIELFRYHCDAARADALRPRRGRVAESRPRTRARQKG